MKKENRQTKLRVAVSVIGVLLAIIIALGVTLGVATKWGKDLDNLKPGKDEEALSSGFLVTTDLSSEPTGGAMQISLNIAADDWFEPGETAGGTSATSMTRSQSYVITATIEPAEADNNVSWGVEWVSSGSGGSGWGYFDEDSGSNWAQGKTASDYVSVVPGDPTTEATVTCLKPFGAQIKVTCTSVSDPSVKAECVCDYIKQIESATFKGQPSANVSPYTISPGGLYVLNSATTHSDFDRVEIVDPVFTAYTIDNTIRSDGFDLSKSYIKFTEEFITSFKRSGSILSSLTPTTKSKIPMLSTDANVYLNYTGAPSSSTKYSIPLANYYNAVGPFVALAEACGIGSSDAYAIAGAFMDWEEEIGEEIFPFEMHVFFTGTKKNFEYSFVFGVMKPSSSSGGGMSPGGDSGGSVVSPP